MTGTFQSDTGGTSIPLLSSYGLVEVKIGGTEPIREGAESLKTLSSKIDSTRMKTPSFMMVLTGIGNFAYKRPEDGVLVVPIGCLKP